MCACSACRARAGANGKNERLTQADKHLYLPAAWNMPPHATLSPIEGSHSTSTHVFVKRGQEAFRPMRVRASARTLVTAADCVGGISIHASNLTVRYSL